MFTVKPFTPNGALAFISTFVLVPTCLIGVKITSEKSLRPDAGSLGFWANAIDDKEKKNTNKVSAKRGFITIDFGGEKSEGSL